MDEDKLFGGYVKMYRRIWLNPYSHDPCWISVWFWLLSNVTHKEMDVLFNQHRITLKPGQLITGRDDIAKKTGVDANKVHRILKLLENEQQIKQQTSPRGRLITVINWRYYQQNEQQNEQQVNNRRTTDEQQVNTNKNDKNVKNDKNIIESGATSFDDMANYDLAIKNARTPKMKLILEICKGYSIMPAFNDFGIAHIVSSIEEEDLKKAVHNAASHTIAEKGKMLTLARLARFLGDFFGKIPEQKGEPTEEEVQKRIDNFFNS